MLQQQFVTTKRSIGFSCFNMDFVADLCIKFSYLRVRGNDTLYSFNTVSLLDPHLYANIKYNQRQ